VDSDGVEVAGVLDATVLEPLGVTTLSASPPDAAGFGVLAAGGPGGGVWLATGSVWWLSDFV
jgi:hypothetical protein